MRAAVCARKATVEAFEEFLFGSLSSVALVVMKVVGLASGPSCGFSSLRGWFVVSISMASMFSVSLKFAIMQLVPRKLS